MTATPKVRIRIDRLGYRSGMLNGEFWPLPGVHDVPEHAALALIADGLATEVPSDTPLGLAEDEPVPATLPVTDEDRRKPNDETPAPEAKKAPAKKAAPSKTASPEIPDPEASS